MASDMSSGCLETIDILDDEKEEGEISLEDVSSSEEGGMGHLTCSYIVNKTRQCSDCKSWSECAPWCTMTHRSKSQSKRDPVKGKENRHHVREAGCATTKHATSTLQEKNDDLVPISSDSDMEIVGLTDTSNRSKARIKKDKRKKKDYEILTIDDLISPSSVDLPITEFGTLKTHYRELSPVHRSGRSKVVSRSPIRKHRSSRASFRSSRSPLNHHKSPILRRSERRLRSPKRSPPRHSPPKRSPPKHSPPKRSPPKRSSPKRSSPLRTARRQPRLSSPPSTRSYIDRHDDVTRLLKKVKHLDSMGSYALESSVDRNKEHQPSSLKEKLSNMLKRVPDNNDNVTYFKEKSNVQSETVNDADDEEDLALLRQKALETKHKKSNLRSSDQLADAESEKALIAKDNDQDEEALQLRMIALRSAVMKKHQNRVQRGIKTNRKPSRSESPFSQSFLDDTPSDELKFASPPCTPSHDSNYIEDMELDTDVEREKEKLPYSPTDKITTNVPIDTMLLGIEPSDVSFINLNETNNSPVFDDADDRLPLPLSTGIAPYNSYLQQIYESQCYPCSPSQNTSETLHSDLNGGPGEFLNHLRDSHSSSVMCDLIDGICCQGGTYSGIPGLMNMPDASSALPVANDVSTPSICPNDILVSTQMQQIAERSNSGILSANVDSNLRDYMCVYETQAISEYSITDSPMTLAVGHTESTSPNESMITIDDLSENETDQLSSPVGDDKNLPVTDYISKGIALYQAAEERTLEEPLYMQGVPDVTKDVNKIPTLINKTLVPASLLRTNKQLQQPLPIMRKRETQLEPTFKSAEMQPVIVTADANGNSGSNFKPIKLRLAKKAAPVLRAPVAFDNSMNESLENASYQKSSSLSSNSDEATDLHSANVNMVASNDSASIRKKRKRIKKYRRKSLDVAQLLDKRNVSCSNNDVNKNVNIMNAFTLNQQIAEFDQSKSNDDNKQQENLIESRESSNLQNATLIQDQPVSINSANTTTENSDVERNDRTASAEFPQEKSIVSHCLSTSLTPNNSDSAAPDKAAEITKDTNDRRQSVDEDENELRAILLASLKRTKPIDTNSASAVPVVTTTTDIQTSTQKTLANTTAFAANTTAFAVNTVSSNVSLASKLNSSETEKKKKIDVMPISTQSGGKRRSSNVETTKGPLKKIAKKAVIPASTKVVNNAKKYQNMIVQKKLNLLKLSNNAKSNENTWSNVNPPKALHASDTQRFVISLGSDTDSESESERHKAVVSTTEKRQVQDSADFEKSLQKFLRDMRKEQEQSAIKPVSSTQATKRDVPPAAQTNKDSSNMHTPLAVRHLPAPQQEEYRRLKQQILEREKLKLQRKVTDSNNSNNNKLLNTNVTASSPVRSISSYEKKDTHVKQNQDKPKESEINAQQSSTEIRKKNVDVGKSASALNTHRVPVNKNVSANIAKHTNSAHLQAKGVKKTIPHNLSIRIVNEIAPSHTSAGNRTIENLDEKQQNVSDKQQNRPALRVLTKEEIYRKYVQVKPDTIGRVVTINDKTALQCDTASASQNHKTTENDVNIEIIDEIDRNNENNNNASVFSNASTTKLSNSFVNSSESRREHEDTMEATMLLSQYEAEREINRNISASLPQESNSNNGGKFDVNADNRSNTNDVWDVLKRDVKVELDSLMSLPKAEQERYLRDTEHNLVARRYTILDNLAEMSGNLRQWDMEKDLQNSLATEVRKLKEQLRIAEERLQRQRDHVSSMGPKVSSAREKINVGRRECFKLSKICSTLGNQLMGKNYILPEAGGQLLSDKLKEIANHTRQFSKKKRIQWDDVPENSNCVSPQQISKSSKDMHVEKNLPLQEEYLTNEAPIINTAETNSETFHLKQSNGDENLSISELSLDPQQMFPDQLTPITRKETVVDASDLHNNEQVTPPSEDNALLFESELCQSTPVQQNDKHAERTCTMDNSELTASSEMESSVTDHFICQENEQNDKGTSPQSSPSPTMTMTTTTTTTTTTATTTTKTLTMTMTRKTTATIAPYISILMHLKTPRNTNPHGVLCPYEMMGICRDEDCQYIHQSRNQT